MQAQMMLQKPKVRAVYYINLAKAESLMQQKKYEKAYIILKHSLEQKADEELVLVFQDTLQLMDNCANELI